MNRKALLICTAAIAILGLGLFALPFSGSLRPSAKADASLPAIDVSNLKPGQLELRDHPLFGAVYGEFRWSVVMLRGSDGTLRVWDVPTTQGRVGMPDIHWWRPFYACENFGLAAAGSIAEEPYIACLDRQLPSESWAQEWRWGIDGKALGPSVDDMQPTVGSIEGKYFVVGKRS